MLATREHLRLKRSLTITRHVHLHLANALEGKWSPIGAMAVMGRLISALLGRATKTLGQFHLHHLAEILADALPNVAAHQIKEWFGLRLNF